MSFLNAAMVRIHQLVTAEAERRAPFRAIVSATDGDLTQIKRLETATADSEWYAKATSETFSANDEVLCLMVSGKPVILGKVRRTPAP